MGNATGISWTDSSWNPWMGCEHVSPGCENCYMFRDMRKYGRDPNTVVRTKTTFNAPLKWKDPRLVFTCSWSDFFHKDADPWRDEAWDIIRRTPQHTYQILTKRHGRIARNLPADWGEGYPNVWLGVSVENQEWANRRVPALLQVPAVVRFLSCEPLLEETIIFSIDGPVYVADDEQSPIHWVIVGGESGPNRRPCEVGWITSIVDQCADAGVACFVKQDSALKPGQQGRIPDSHYVHEWPVGAGVTLEEGEMKE